MVDKMWFGHGYLMGLHRRHATAQSAWLEFASSGAKRQLIHVDIKTRNSFRLEFVSGWGVGRSYKQNKLTDRPFTIPQATHDWYNAHYNNKTYRAVRVALENLDYPLSETNNSDFIDMVMNLLIDASFERCNPACFPGAEKKLFAALLRADSACAAHASNHLANFGAKE